MRSAKLGCLYNRLIQWLNDIVTDPGVFSYPLSTLPSSSYQLVFPHGHKMAAEVLDIKCRYHYFQKKKRSSLPMYLFLKASTAFPEASIYFPQDL